MCEFIILYYLDCITNKPTTLKGLTVTTPGPPDLMTTDSATTKNDATTDISNQSASIVADNSCMYIISTITIFAMVPNGWSEPLFTLAVLSGYYLQGKCIIILCYKCKSRKMDGSIGMARLKSTQKRVVGVITSTVHPYTRFSRLLWAC